MVKFNLYNSGMVFDPTYPDIEYGDFQECDWKEFYEDVNEAMPPNALGGFLLYTLENGC